MNTPKVIRKILFIALWVAIGSGMLVLLIAAIGKQKRDHCKDYVIRIKGVQNNLFVDDKDVLKLLKVSAKGNIKGQKKSSFDLQKMEQVLEDNVWVKDAELYFDNKDVLHVLVTEREPIARIFNVAGKSFYMDETEKMMPVSDKLSAKVPVFTGFPAKVLSRRDSALMHDVKAMAKFIMDDPFWTAQVAQVDITTEREFEMIPVVGNHTVIFGNGENIKQKFHRLFVFYKNVLSQTGFDKYKAINVEYAGQVVGIKNSGKPKVDTSQLRLNIEKLLRQAREVQTDSAIMAKELKEQRSIPVDPAIAATEKSAGGNNDIESKAESFTSPVLVTDPVSMKPFSKPKSGDGKGEPKAVMKKSVGQ